MVRGVGAGGIVSTAYCLLYKLFTLKLTRKQINGLITHPDSPYIRGLGFMYISQYTTSPTIAQSYPEHACTVPTNQYLYYRDFLLAIIQLPVSLPLGGKVTPGHRYTQPPADLWDWYDQYLEDPEELDVKAGGGQTMTVGDMLRAFLTKLEWFSTLFSFHAYLSQYRYFKQKLEKKMSERFPPVVPVVRQPKIPPAHPQASKEARHIPDEEMSFGEAERFSRLRRTDDRPSPNKDRRTECLFTNKERRSDRLSPTKERRNDRLSPSKERRNDRLSPSKERRNDRLSPSKERRNDRLSPNKERRSNRPISRERSPLSRHRQHSPSTKHRSHQRPRSGEIQRTRDIKDRFGVTCDSKTRLMIKVYMKWETRRPETTMWVQKKVMRSPVGKTEIIYGLDVQESRSGSKHKSSEDIAEEIRREKDRQRREKEHKRERDRERSR
uniref:Pre-mRNA-splicing factor 38 n=1 Tax=Timema genevievae TaxID=629358 RepID=A0A7R9PNL7_TIMGE|nr:unnamed protein product [Timema genevievae]